MKHLFGSSFMGKQGAGVVSFVLLNKAAVVPAGALRVGAMASNPALHYGGTSTRLRSSTGKVSFSEDADHDFEWLKKSRPIRIRAEKVEFNEDGSMIKHVDDDAAAVNSKIIHFQRHGQGTHNEVHRLWTEKHGSFDLSETDPEKNPLLRPDVIDAALTPKGRGQCAEQRDLASKLNVELVVMSPLLRTLQTAQLTFGDNLQRNSVPWVANELIREELGSLLCNKRRPLSQTQPEFPHVDFSLLPQHPNEDDVMWTKYVFGNVDEHGNPSRESMVDMANRSYNFLIDFVRNREEKEIAVVGHSAWLHSMCHAVLDCDDDSLLPVFAQAELRSMRFSFHGEDSQ